MSTTNLNENQKLEQEWDDDDDTMHSGEEEVVERESDEETDGLSSRPQLNLSGAEIQGNFEDRDLTILLPYQSNDISHFALDIGGSLIKLVYFSRHEDRSGGKLHFVKFETRNINDCLDFISSNHLHLGNDSGSSETSSGNHARIKVTGGGAFKFADLFKEKLGVTVEKEDEMGSLVAGANVLLKTIYHEAFTLGGSHKEFVQIDHNNMYPYLLVNIGTGVSIDKVDGDGKFQLVGGTNVGGGTYWGLGKLLTKCQSFDELLELSQQGDFKAIDMFVEDIYGSMDYSKIGFQATYSASIFGKPISENKQLEDYRPEDIALSLLRMITSSIGQISYLNALRFGIKRIFFGGSFLRHACTMDNISNAVRFWSRGEAQAMFLRHEGFLGALGAFMSYQKHGLDDLTQHKLFGDRNEKAGVSKAK